MFQKSVPALDTNQMHLISSFWVVCKQGNYFGESSSFDLDGTEHKGNESKDVILKRGLVFVFWRGAIQTKHNDDLLFYFL